MTDARRTGARAAQALLYRRVSTEDQAREGVSLEAQKSRTRRYAVAAGWVIAGEFEDVQSGADNSRPRYLALLERARVLRSEGQDVTVVVTWLDRFGRSVHERARCSEELRRLSVSLHSVMEGGPVPELVSNLMAAVAQEEVRRLGERVAAHLRGGVVLPLAGSVGVRPSARHGR
jgi:site-specific DNA recombinase